MKTLLTEKQVYKIHKGDNHSARTRVKAGYTADKGKYTLVLVDKIIFKINKCPHCGSTNSFHKRAQRVGGYDNVYRAEKDIGTNSATYHKIDYCLDCHKEFSIEMFCYDKINRPWFKRIKRWFKK